ncbi:TIGR04211 family SH3 domain-containing protein [Nitrosomonas sp. Nm166]|uniref:TIGR04211 family SH3 domain-containing protein n=1 Tax=Nitrosomonas sp. Nm166 TaxID=1881054 RepID=UPI0008EE983D|nr:TIGR04211 family SH3 domain-containing protein [Nitrosomonas sp. Nm166]SFF02353.1 SH3 domain protein [Nitrosomonas sp. Nm166]
MMRKYKYVALLIGFICCTLYSLLVSAETRYVSDQLEVTLRKGPSLSHAIVRMLKSGTALEVLEIDAETGHTRVKTNGGVEGWILSRYLSAEPTARMQLERMFKEIGPADNPDHSVLSQLKTIKSEYESAHQRIAKLESENKQLEAQLASIKKTSANVLSIDEENKKLHQKLAMTEERLNNLQLENIELGDHRQKDWLITGALILVGGLLLGLILPLFTRRKRSRYDSFI